VEQDSNLRRQCHQIYSLAPLAAWVSTRLVPGFREFSWIAEPTPARTKTNPLETLPAVESQSWRRDSNSQPSVYKTDALPIELRQQPGP
jgi:hypothetical protein